ncbi:hypothetical protein NDU88_007359 [Pleurodeles waltl]|uniref:Uncharacterized protein n=1 Tax=Pleurodeles waltl TaxID=8319 RepID=A0AAV7U053_PLEWA|nr:hypothetical protein NDU88_007359 [Pleurodeles waltl]
MGLAPALNETRREWEGPFFKKSLCVCPRFGVLRLQETHWQIRDCFFNRGAMQKHWSPVTIRDSDLVMVDNHMRTGLKRQDTTLRTMVKGNPQFAPFKLENGVRGFHKVRSGTGWARVMFFVGPRIFCKAEVFSLALVR